MSNYISLSHVFKEKLSAYGDGTGLKIESLKSLANGDSSNNSALSFSSYFEIHIDFPLHFRPDGKKSSDYEIWNLIFNKIGIFKLSIQEENLIIYENLKEKSKILKKDTEFLMIKTGYSDFRNGEKYWKFNPGFHPNLAAFLRSHFQSLKGSGFDTISLSCYQNREMGRAAHKEFLCKNNLLIVQDLNLSNVNCNTEIKRLVVVLFLVENIEAATVNVLTENE